MKKRFLIVPIFALFSVLFFSSNASAATVPDTVKFKAAYEGVYQCLLSGEYKTTYGASFLASEGGKAMFNNSISIGGDPQVKLPYGLTDAADNNTNCKEIMIGWFGNARSDDNLNVGLLPRNVRDAGQALVVKNYFAGEDNNGGPGTMGYEAKVETTGIKEGQATEQLSIIFNTDQLNDDTCRVINGGTDSKGVLGFYPNGVTSSDILNKNGGAENTVITAIKFPVITKDESGNFFYGDSAVSSAGAIDVPVPGSGGTVSYHYCNDDSDIQISDSGDIKDPHYNIYVSRASYSAGAFGGVDKRIQVYEPTPSEFVSAKGSKWDFTANTGLFKGSITPATVDNVTDFADYRLTYKGGNVEQRKKLFIRTLSKLNSSNNGSGTGYHLGAIASYDSLKLTQVEIYSLYTYYVKDVFRYPVYCTGDANFKAYNESNSKKIENWASGKTCYIDTAAMGVQNPSNVYGVDDNWHFTKKVDIEDIIKTFGELNPNVSEKVADGETSGYIPGGSTSSVGSSDESGSPEASTCSTASGSLGWFICPVVQLISNAASGVYDTIEKRYLQVDPKYISDSGTKNAWEIFRTYANIVFVILLLIVIFSQITGFGISNYGIKKTLPTIIMVAILVNLSFFMCEIAVDLSNLVGSGLKQLFTSLPVGGQATGDVSLGAIAGGLGFSFLEGAGAIAGITIAFNSYELWILPLLLMLLTAMISIFTFYILLAVRQAGIIILVTLSPLAIVCYALPNTKKIFERWWKILSALLLVYPICGALVGGGQFASKLLLNVGASAGNNSMPFPYAFVAVLLQAVPIFFVPTILRSSMSAMGNIGLRLSNMGRGLGRGIAGAARRSDAYKDMQSRAAARNAKRLFDREEWNQKHKYLGFAGRKVNEIDSKIRSKDNAVSRMFQKRYDRRRAGYIDAIAKQKDADLRSHITVAGGIEGAERRQNTALRKFYEDTYGNDTAFTSDLDMQETAYEQALDDVTADPDSREKVEKLRALQNIIGKSPDGQDRIARVINKKLFNAQNAGGTPTVSTGLQKARETLISDHGGFKSGNRGLAGMLKGLSDGSVFAHGKFEQIGTDIKGNPIYGNTYYAAQSANGSAQELANANDDAIRALDYSIGKMDMDSESDGDQLINIYGNLSEAVANETIPIKGENKDKFNDMRQKIWNQFQALGHYQDTIQGRNFVHVKDNVYQYSDQSGVAHQYIRDKDGNFRAADGSETIYAKNMKRTKRGDFESQYGDKYRALSPGDVYKIEHAQVPKLPDGWSQRKNGKWYNKDGKQLSPADARMAQRIQDRIIDTKIDSGKI